LQVLIDSLLVLEAKRCELFESVAHHVDVFEQREDLALLYDEVERFDRYFFLSSADLKPFTALLGFIHHVIGPACMPRRCSLGWTPCGQRDLCSKQPASEAPG
jgi:hypothetical protein